MGESEERIHKHLFGHLHGVAGLRHLYQTSALDPFGQLSGNEA